MLTIYKYIESVKRKQNLFNLDSYDIEQYISLYRQAHTEFMSMRLKNC
jgi:hypothetical protein